MGSWRAAKGPRRFESKEKGEGEEGRMKYEERKPRARFYPFLIRFFW
jgi:hypothetical protein